MLFTTPRDLLGYVPDLRARPQGQGSWKLQRDGALDELVGLIKKRIAPRHEDVLPGRQFVRAHALEFFLIKSPPQSFPSQRFHFI